MTSKLDDFIPRNYVTCPKAEARRSALKP